MYLLARAPDLFVGMKAGACMLPASGDFFTVGSLLPLLLSRVHLEISFDMGMHGNQGKSWESDTPYSFSRVAQTTYSGQNANTDAYFAET